MIWRNTSELGIGTATKKNKKGKFCTYIVGRYAVDGNIAKMYMDNVPKGNFDRSMCGEISRTAHMAMKELERSYIQRFNLTG